MNLHPRAFNLHVYGTVCMELCVCVCARLRQFLFKLSASFPSHLGPAGSWCDAASSRPFLHLQVTLGFPILAPKHPMGVQSLWLSTAAQER